MTGPTQYSLEPHVCAWMEKLKRIESSPIHQDIFVGYIPLPSICFLLHQSLIAAMTLEYAESAYELSARGLLLPADTKRPNHSASSRVSINFPMADRTRLLVRCACDSRSTVVAYLKQTAQCNALIACSNPPNVNGNILFSINSRVTCTEGV